jgi:hypothetical protein
MTSFGILHVRLQGPLELQSSRLKSVSGGFTALSMVDGSLVVISSGHSLTPKNGRLPLAGTAATKATDQGR